MNRQAMRALLIFLLAWVVLVAVAPYALRRTPRSVKQTMLFEVPIYPGARNMRRDGSAEIRWLVVSYEIDAQPPAMEVVQYYEQELRSRGWRTVKPTNTMQWQHTSGERRTDVLWREWLSKDELLRFDLGLSYARGIGAMPGRMTVRAAVTRNLPITGIPGKDR